MKPLLPISVRSFLKVRTIGRKAAAESPRHVVVLTILSIMLFLALWWWLPQPYAVTLPIRTSRAVQLKLYYAEEDSKFREDWTSVRFADSRGTFKPVRLPVARNKVQALRLHVFPGAIVDIGPAVLTPLGRTGIAIPPADITVVNASCKAEPMDGFTRFRTGPDSDGFDLDIKSSRLPLRNARNLEPAVVILLSCFLLTLIWTAVRTRRTSAGGTALPMRRTHLSPKTSRRIVAACTLILVIATLLKLNGSSSAMWRFYADGRRPGQDLILGSAKDVRADEWMVQTPWILSQGASEPRFPVTNPNVGDLATALVANLPLHHWTTIFRPQFWGFFLLQFEYAFAWYWNLKWYAVIVGGFLFFRLVSRANVLAAAAGTSLVFFAPYIQWWYSTGACLPETVGMTFVGLWAFHTVSRARTRWAIALSAAVLLFSIENFIYCCYPRFQIPLLYFAALVAGWLFLTSPPRHRYRALRYSCLAAVLVLVIFCGWIWYGEVGPTLRMTAQLEYPGKVFSVGGEFPWVQFFIPFLQFGMTEFHYPAGLVNASNASGFVLLLPFLLALLITSSRGKRDALVAIMVMFIAAVGYFMLVGVAPALARYSGWSLVYSTRCILPVGIASIVCLVRLLAWKGRHRITRPSFAVAAALALGVAAWFGFSMVNKRYQEYVSAPMVAAAAGYLAAVTVMVLCERRTNAIALLTGPILAATAFVNPISRGLPGFYRSESYQFFRSFTQRDRTGRWLLLGSDARTNYLPYLVKAAGADVLNGIRCNPDMRLLSVLDPEKQQFNVWNRFAVISYVASKDGKAGFNLTSGVSYTIALPLNPELLDRLGVRYILSVDLPVDDEIPGFRTVGRHNGFLLRMRDVP